MRNILAQKVLVVLVAQRPKAAPTMAAFLSLGSEPLQPSAQSDAGDAKSSAKAAGHSAGQPQWPPGLR